MKNDKIINLNIENTANNDSSCNNDDNGVKAKRRRKSMPRESPSQRSSVYRGVTRHRWTDRYEAHLWDKNCWNESQNKKGKQVYLGAHDDEKAAAHAYDLAALKYWGRNTILNFPASRYQEELKEMEGQTREEYIGSLRRKSSGFSRGVSKYRGVARHHHNGRWEARIGRVFGNKYLYLGTYATQEEAATAYDMAAIEYRGHNAVTNFDLSRYAKWLRPNSNDSNAAADQGTDQGILSLVPANQTKVFRSNFQQQKDIVGRNSQSPGTTSSSDATASAIELLLQSSKFKEMLELSSLDSSSTLPPACDCRPSSCSFPDDIQTYFECQDSRNCSEEEDGIFGDLSSFISPFQCQVDI